ncbi:MAG: glycosyltransferase family 4 protein [Acidobacteriota bacterium]
MRNEFPLEVTIVGDGPVRASLERENAERNLEGIVRFAGALPLPEVSRQMRSAHVFCLPCVRESGGAVLLESLASGVPVIAVNYGGPAEIVDDEVGQALSAEGRGPLVRDLVAALRDAARNPETWRLRGRHGRVRAEENYGWDARMNTALKLYAGLTGGQTADV